MYRVVVKTLIKNYEKSYKDIKIKISPLINSSNLFLSCKTQHQKVLVYR